jgi:hypothetical protein
MNGHFVFTLVQQVKINMEYVSFNCSQYEKGHKQLHNRRLSSFYLISVHILYVCDVVCHIHKTVQLLSEF